MKREFNEISKYVGLQSHNGCVFHAKKQTVSIINTCFVLFCSVPSRILFSFYCQLILLEKIWSIHLRICVKFVQFHIHTDTYTHESKIELIDIIIRANKRHRLVLCLFCIWVQLNCVIFFHLYHIYVIWSFLPFQK